MADVKQVQEYKDNVKAQAEQLVLKGFPETIVKLNNILETPQFKNRVFTDVHQDLNIPIPDPILVNSHTELPPAKKTKYDNSISKEGSKVMVLPTGSVPTNKHLVELVESVKPHIRKLVEDSNLMKMWISFMIPKIEDGNNFGVSVQEDTLAEVQSVESEAAAFFDQISRYYISREIVHYRAKAWCATVLDTGSVALPYINHINNVSSDSKILLFADDTSLIERDGYLGELKECKLISKVAKYPHIDDYRRAVQELDEKEYLSLWLVMSEIRNRYCALHDIVLKNLDKIKKPRSSNASESLY